MSMSHTRRLAPLGVIAVAAALAGCVEMAVVGVGAAVLGMEDRRTAGTQVEDEGIELRAMNRVNERYREKAHVNITSFNRSVLLTGEAPDAAAREEIEKLVRSVPNLAGVTNDIQVGPSSTLASRSNDTIITSKVKARFIDAGTVNPIHVKVVTEAAVVYLLGLVTEAEANAAVEIARTTGGVRKVVKVFEYCKPTDAACKPRPK